MANPVQDILWRFIGDPKDLLSANRKVRTDLGQTDKAASKSATAWSGLRKTLTSVGVAFGAFQAARWAQDAVQMAVAAEEVDSKFEAVYGSAENLNESLEQWGNMAGVTTTQAKNLAATFGNLAMAQGISADATEALAMDVATLAGDMASFNDEDPSVVFNDLNKALLTTEREGMKKYGIAINEAEVKTRAAAIAAEDGRDEITKADRAYASYAIAVQQAGRAVGDLERTSDSAANKQRQMKASVAELQEEIGRELLPAMEDLLEVAVELAPAMQGVATAVGYIVNPTDKAAEAAVRLREEQKKANQQGQWWREGLLKLQEMFATAGPMYSDTADAISEIERAQIEAAQSTVHWADQLPRATAAAQDNEREVRTLGSRYLEFAVEAREAVEEAASAMEAAESRVAAAAGRWVGILDDIAGAYERTAKKAAAMDFLARGEQFEGAGNPYANGRQSADAINRYNKVNGLD